MVGAALRIGVELPRFARAANSMSTGKFGDADVAVGSCAVGLLVCRTTSCLAIAPKVFKLEAAKSKWRAGCDGPGLRRCDTSTEAGEVKPTTSRFLSLEARKEPSRGLIGARNGVTAVALEFFLKTA
eukprot:CAMPEP_0206290134 /NCGR_PEP_ID=MMETSP0106_2-20121207/2467_1 /ASSEMBLY_ACC=CAM_ASM_000206 /TAXON_ID=81532 /ORGANISM="Acanthoeca-like sp., Strain 10tr" /LENGTH=126 /DNA_ID=CAMNT_0053720693 /DNA_START=343 /DNA_END=723 /DNA_ORIENTATION=-